MVYDNDVMLLTDTDYEITSSAGVCTLTFTEDYNLTLGNTINIRFFNKNNWDKSVESLYFRQSIHIFDSYM